MEKIEYRWERLLLNLVVRYLDNLRSKRLIATSTTEAEHSAYLDVCKEMLWLRQLRKDIITRMKYASKHKEQILNEGLKEEEDVRLEATAIYSDNTMAIKTAKE